LINSRDRLERKNTKTKKRVGRNKTTNSVYPLASAKLGVSFRLKKKGWWNGSHGRVPA
jgi:hypothetical protein